MAIDPVCGMEVKEKTATITSSYKGKIYYFCAPGCKRMFDKDQESYIGDKRKPFVPMRDVPDPK